MYIVNVSKCWRSLQISQNEMGKVIGVTPQRVAQLKKDGTVVADDQGKILLVQSLQNIHRLDQGDSGAEGVSLDEERALHEKAKREMAEIKLGEMKNDMHSTDDIIYIIGNMVVVFRRTLLSLPSKMATSLAGKSPEDINEILTKEITRALQELSEFDAEKLADMDVEGDDDE